MKTVILQLEIDVSLAKYLLALYSALSWLGEPDFDDLLIHQDLPIALLVIRDQLLMAESYENLEWDEKHNLFIESFVNNTA